MQNRVTEYKVCKAIANGVPLNEETLTMATQRPAHEVRKVLVKMYPDLFGTPGVDVPLRPTATLDELVRYARPMYERDGIDAILVLQPYEPQACGCMSPQGEDPLCPCHMRIQLEKNKAAVAALFMEDES